MYHPNKLYCSRLAGGLSLALLMAACSADYIPESPESQLMPVAFAPGFHETVTRSTLDNSWDANTAITVRRVSDSKTYDYTTATSGNTVSLTGTSGARFYWPPSNPNWQFDAWPTAYGSRPLNKTLTVAANQSSADLSAYDILYCPAVSATYRQTVPLVFFHQPARVTVIVNTNVTEGKKAVTSVAFGGSSLGLTGNITALNTSAANGTTTWDITSTKNQSITMKHTASDNTNHVYQFECILPPQSGGSASTQLVKITTDGGNTYTYKGTFALQSGYSYTYQLVASARGVLTLSSLQIVDWDAKIGVEDIKSITK